MRYKLPTEFIGLKLNNPVFLASGVAGFGEEYSKVFDLNCLGGFITKTITLKPRIGNPPPRVIEIPSGMINSIGLENPGLEKFIDENLPVIRKLFKIPVIVSIGGETLSEFVEIVKRLNNQVGISGYELNLSCPNIKKNTTLPYNVIPRIAVATAPVATNSERHAWRGRGAPSHRLGRARAQGKERRAPRSGAKASGIDGNAADLQSDRSNLFRIASLSARNNKIGLRHTLFSSALICQNSKLTYEIVSSVRKVTKRPIVAKLSAAVTDITEVAESCKSAGADALSLINSYPALYFGSEKNTAKTLIFGGLSGPTIKPIALRLIYEVVTKVKIPIMGVGGIVSAEDALEFFYAGASTIAIGSGIFKDPKLPLKVIDYLKKFKFNA